jgi:putative tricarboxylic transport membrane protein
MTLSKERIGALFFLVVSIAYGYFASEIKLYPGDELDPMTAQTLPYVLSAMGITFSLFLLINGNHKEFGSGFAHLNWKPVIALMLLTLFYGFSLDWLGFLISTTVFLIAGFRSPFCFHFLVWFNPVARYLSGTRAYFRGLKICWTALSQVCRPRFYQPI